jgi:hypothetical protein
MCGAFERVVFRTLSSSVSNQRGSSCWRCFTLAEIPLSGSAAHNKQLQRTAQRHRGRAASAPFHFALASLGRVQRAAAELRRYADMGPLTTILRNELRLKPIARKAARDVIELLRTKAVSCRAVEVWLGLGEPNQLRCAVFVPDDVTRERCEFNGHTVELLASFQKALTPLKYPSAAIPRVRVNVHSDEAIRRAGGHHRYFN